MVVADDLTGANATAAGFAEAGLRAVTIGSGQGPEVLAEFGARFDVVVVSTDTRHSPPAEAAARVTTAVRAGWPATLVCNRIDSTLRGNVGVTTSAILRAVTAEAGRRAVALCTPAHPNAGRHTVDGTQLLDGARLEDTELAQDPRAPITDSRVATRLLDQADLAIEHVGLSSVTGDVAELGAALRERVAAGADVIITDALTTEHLDRIAQAAVAANAAVTAADESIVWVAVDPGPMSVALARAMQITERADGAPILAVSGSATRLTRTQLARLRAELPVITVHARPGPAGPVPDVDQTSAALLEALASASAGEVVLLATVLEDTDVTGITPDEAELLPRSLARAVRRALEQHTVDGLFATGGDVSAALFAELAASGLDVERELVPLAVAGTFVGGPWAGLPVVTKGGLVGDAGTTVACVEHLQRAAEAARRHVRAAQSRTLPTSDPWRDT
nr:four-carbon acid sugar kinase family protein [Phytoactinopolyspora alkaliphila]